MLEGDNYSSDEYCEELTCHPLTDLLDQSQQLQNQFVSLKSNIPQFTHTKDLLQHIGKLQHLTMAFQPAPPVH